MLLQVNEWVANLPMLYTGPRKLSVASLSLGAGKLVVFWHPWDLSSHLTALRPLLISFSHWKNLYLIFFFYSSNIALKMPEDFIVLFCCFSLGQTDVQDQYLHTISNSPHSPSERPEILNSANITDHRNCVSCRLCWMYTNMCLVFWNALARVLLWHLA